MPFLQALFSVLITVIPKGKAWSPAHSMLFGNLGINTRDILLCSALHTFDYKEQAVRPNTALRIGSL